jgi:hypothetical protein
MTYSPQVNDYVKWTEYVEGWVYFKDEKYITIEAWVQPKDVENYQACSLHRNDRLLVLCYNHQWNQLCKVGYRTDKHSTEIIKKET